MSGTLIVPQVQVKWGSRNLSAYTLPQSDGPQAIVYNTKVDLPGDSWPTASFFWNPTGPAFDVYQECVTSGKDDTIEIRFYYVNGPYILFQFQFNGANISYGNDLSIETLLVTRNAGKSSGVRSTAMEDYTKGKFNAKGVDAYKASQDLWNSFGKPIPVKYSMPSKEAMKKIFLASWQHKDQTFGAIMKNHAAQVGDKIALTNISSDGQANQFGPFTWEGQQNMDSVKFPPGPGGTPKGEQRYGYLIGPGIIDSFTRAMEYPSQTQGLDASTTQPVNTPNKPQGPKVPGSQPLKSQEDQNKAQKEAQNKSVTNPSSPSTTKNEKFTKNDLGPEKQQLMQQEDQGVKLQSTFFMCPALVGIKPQDIIYVPSLRIGDTLMEDYKVGSVSYQQDGASVSISVSASRSAGMSNMMNEAAGKKFLQKSDSLKTIEDWTNYAWKERMGG